MQKDDVARIAAGLDRFEREWLTGWNGPAGAAFNVVATGLLQRGCLSALLIGAFLKRARPSATTSQRTTMTNEVAYVECSGLKGNDEVCFTIVYRDGTRRVEWRDFWLACWLVVRLTFKGIEVRDAFDE